MGAPTKRSRKPGARVPTKLSPRDVAARLKALPGWARDGNAITRTFSFESYCATMAFVNAVAWLAEREDHHPELQVGYDRCRVAFSTHSAGGVSERDFDCAAKTEALRAA